MGICIYTEGQRWGWSNVMKISRYECEIHLPRSLGGATSHDGCTLYPRSTLMSALASLNRRVSDRIHGIGRKTSP